MAGKKILLVEGIDDEHVLKHVCGTRGLPRLDEIRSHGGAEQLLESFPVRLKESEIEAIGVVIDADTDLAARWLSLRNRLMQAGYESVPNDPVPAGTVLQPPSGTLLPRVGLWIMPDNQTTGILEDFLRFLVPQGSCLFAHVQASIAGIPQASSDSVNLPNPRPSSTLGWRGRRNRANLWERP